MFFKAKTVFPSLLIKPMNSLFVFLKRLQVHAKTTFIGAEKIAQWLGKLAEGLGSIPSMHIQLKTTSNSSFRGNSKPPADH